LASSPSSPLPDQASVGPPGTALDTFWAHGAGQQAGTLGVAGRRADHAAAVDNFLAAPHPAHLLHLPIHAAIAALESGAHRGVVFLPPAVTNRHGGDPPPRQDIEGGDFLGHPGRAVHRQDVERGGDLDAVGNGGRSGQDYPHVVGRAVDPLAAGQRVKGALVDRPEPGQVILPAEPGFHVGQADPDLHTGRHCGRLTSRLQTGERMTATSVADFPGAGVQHAEPALYCRGAPDKRVGRGCALV